MAKPTVWTCPTCRRQFGSSGQGHMCSPGLSIEEFLDASASFVEPVFRRVEGVLRAADDDTPDGALIVDPIDKKVLFKNGATFAIVDVKTKWVAVGFNLRRRLESARMSRKVVDHGGKYYHVINVDDPDLIDDEVEAWLTEAYRGEASSEVDVRSSDPMIPDDIDFEIAPPR